MPNNQEDFIPVYVFTGFLESGKTKFVQNALEDKRFSNGERTLLLVCEEGIEEYDLSRIPQDSYTMQVIEDISDLNPENLQKLLDDCAAERVVIEYNGMWQLKDLFENMPDDWGVYQLVTVVDASTFPQYNANLRSLVVDKLSMCELVYFNRVEKDTDTQALHQIVRGISRRNDIYYEYTDGNTVFDDIEDPLPFDVEAAHIDIEDRDFALWFRDLTEDPEKYDGKEVCFKGLAVKNNTFPKHIFAIGRHIMTCCVEDIQYCWIAADYNQPFTPGKDCWVQITGTMGVQKQRLRGTKAPVMHVTALTKTDPPEQTVATFY